ncbi:hypothetical protein C1Y40_03027 [Mycobacterium talmoniae]|uniref:Uncharacterized protein n=1 Tax=Mycobacterium talmoniae TaxID=1858794 RepID=A0A2S8BJL9_9MYCO|nr:hypothetical protein C1Y40_03027 [Mycobacterium talmoniae]
MQRQQGLPDLLAGEKAFAAADLVGDAGLGQRLLVDLGLGVDPVQHRDLGRFGAGVDEPGDLFGHRGGLGDLVGVLVKRRHRTGVALPDQVQLAARHPAAGGGDDPVGQRHHLRGGAVVAFQAHHGGVREAPGEVQQVARGGAGERVDGLVGVADHGQVVAIAQPRRQHPLLQRRDVLVLVDDKAAVAVPEFFGDARIVFDRGGGVQQQVVEVEQRHLTACLERLVPGVQAGDLRGVQRDVAAGGGHRVRVLFGTDQRRLGPLDFAGHVADVVAGQVQAGAVGGAGDGGELAVQQLPAGVPHHPRPEVPQLAARGGVKGQGLHRPDPGAGLRGGVQRAQPAPHLPAARWVNVTASTWSRGDVTGPDELGDAVGDGPGLAGPGPGQHAHRAARRQHGLTLLVVQAGDQRVLAHRHGVHLGSRDRQHTGAGIIGGAV